MPKKPGPDTLYEKLVIKTSLTNGRLPSYDQMDLTDDEMLRLEKLSFIDDLIRRKRPILRIADIYKLYALKYKSDGQRFFNRMYYECQQLFGSTGIKEKNYQKSIYVTWLEDAASIALKQGDIKAFKECIAECAKLQDLYTPEDLNRKLNETPRQILVMINQFMPDGTKAPKIIDLDEIDKMKPSEFNKYIDEVQNIDYPVSEIEKELNK